MLHLHRFFSHFLLPSLSYPASQLFLHLYLLEAQKTQSRFENAAQVLSDTAAVGSLSDLMPIGLDDLSQLNKYVEIVLGYIMCYSAEGHLLAFFGRSSPRFVRASPSMSNPKQVHARPGDDENLYLPDASETNEARRKGNKPTTAAHCINTYLTHSLNKK